VVLEQAARTASEVGLPGVTIGTLAELTDVEERAVRALRSWRPTSIPTFSICGIQFLVSGDVRDWRMLAHRSMADLEAAGVRLLLNTTANDVEVDARRLSVADGDGREVGAR